MLGPILAGFALAFTTNPLPGTNPSALAVDPAGNIYIAGYVIEAANANPTEAFVAKLDPSATRVLYRSRLPGSGARALALGPEGSVYVAGNNDASPSFVVKLDSAGVPRYTTAVGNAGAWISAMAVTPAGEAVVTGWSGAEGFPTTPGALTSPSSHGVPFLMKLNSAGSAPVFAATGVGGSSVALDAQSNIYVAGSVGMVDQYPTTPGAFQTTFTPAWCGNFSVAARCGRQYVSKINSTGTALLYSTFVTGSISEIPTALAVDAEGYVYLTGASVSRDYPVTTGAFQTEFRSRVVGYRVLHPAYTAYVTKLNRDGTGVVYSTYLGGVGADVATGLKVDAAGVAYVAGWTSSRDFPGIPLTSALCLPADLLNDGPPPRASPFPGLIRQGFVTRLNPDGSALLGTEMLPGRNTSFTTMALGPGGRAIVFGGAPPQFLAALDLEAPVADRRVSCVKDTSDLSFADVASPGQLLTLIGVNLGPSAPALPPPGDVVPNELAGLRVSFDGVPASLVYAAPDQINFTVPYEVPPGIATTMRVEFDGAVVDERRLSLVDRNPSAFVETELLDLECRSEVVDSNVSGRILNQDGSRNRCQSPAEPGSVIALFLNGLGLTEPRLADGAVHRPPLVRLGLPVGAVLRYGFYSYRSEVVFAGGADGQVSGIWQVNVRLPEPMPRLGGGSSYYALIYLSVDGAPVRPERIGLWIRPSEP
jgi:uncharacterized protein (TIGR03437 family)